MFLLFILFRLLSIASLVFILGYVFGGFSRSPRLTRITKVAAIVMAITFIATNIAVLRFANWRYGDFHRSERLELCAPKDSIVTSEKIILKCLL